MKTPIQIGPLHNPDGTVHTCSACGKRRVTPDARLPRGWVRVVWRPGLLTSPVTVLPPAPHEYCRQKCALAHTNERGKEAEAFYARAEAFYARRP